MPRIQKSIEVSVPVHALYARLTQFEDYPRFMSDVETVRRLDDTHLHWTTRISHRDVEWDAAIIEQVPDRCIAWQNTSGPTNAGKVELEPAGPDTSRVILTLEAELEQVPGSSTGNSETEMSQRLQEDLLRLKDFVENSMSGSRREDVHGVNAAAGDTGAGTRNSAPYAAGSEGWDGSEDPEQPVISANRAEADRAGEAVPPTPFVAPSVAPSSQNQEKNQAASFGQLTQAMEPVRNTQSDYSLSEGARDADEDHDASSVAEEVNFDEQSAAARRVGQMPAETSSAGAAEGMAKAMKLDEQESANKEKLKDAIERNVPPSD